MGPSLRAYNHFCLQYPLLPTFPASWRQGWEIQTGSSGIGKWNNVKKRSENRLWGVGIDVGECFHEAEEADAGKVLHKAEGQTQKDISGRCSRRKTILGVSFHAFKNFPQRTFKMSMPRFLLRWGCCDPQVTFFQLSGLMEPWQSQQCVSQSGGRYLTLSLVTTQIYAELISVTLGPGHQLLWPWVFSQEKPCVFYWAKQEYHAFSFMVSVPAAMFSLRETPGVANGIGDTPCEMLIPWKAL